MAEFIETHRGGKAMLNEGYKYYRIREGKEGKVFWTCEFHKAGCEELPQRWNLSSSNWVAEHFVKRRDLMKRENRFQHCLNNLSRDNTALVRCHKISNWTLV